MKLTITVILCSTLATLLIKCTPQDDKSSESISEFVLSKPRTLVIDEVSCKKCVRDIVENYANLDYWDQIVFVTADNFGQTTLSLDPNIVLVPRNALSGQQKATGSFFIDNIGDTILINSENYKSALKRYIIQSGH